MTLNSICDGSWFAKDEDEEYYVEYFRDLFIAQGKKTIETIRKNVFQLTKKYGKYKRSLKDSQKLFEAEKTISQYAWLLCKYNKKCKSKGTDPIPYTLKFYDRLMKAEIILL